jgi:predicted component of type VI protein secretion system
MQVKLKILKGSRKDKLLPVQGTKLLIGRGNECDLRPRTELISRKHCLITMTDSQVMIRDLGSKNGTFVNGERIEVEHGLQNGDRLGIGPMEFELQIDSQASAKRPEVQGMSDVIQRTTQNPTGSATDFNVGSWLDEVDEQERAERRADPETRQFKLDETEQLPVNGTTVNPSDTTIDGRSDSSQEKPKFDKNAGKLPRISKTRAKDSREAAQEMLKKFFTK